MAAVPSLAILLLLEPLFSPTAKGIVPVLRIRSALTRGRISVEAAVFLSAGPAPRLSASLARVEPVLMIEAAGKDVVARGVLERPAAAPGALLRIR